MKKLLSATFLIVTTLVISGQKSGSKSEPVNSVSDKMFSYPPNSIKIEGYLGDKIDLGIEKRIKSQDVEMLVEPFRHKDETHLWQSEFWGKWIQSAIASYEYNRDPLMLSIIQSAVNKLLATQMIS
ncbi:MAG TPA: hypothetical protein VF346_03105, partial [Bacteroidales bacterium]